MWFGVGYTVPTSGSKLQDTLGNAAAALTAEAVANRTAKPTVMIESAGSFPTKDAFAVTITFSVPVTGFLAIRGDGGQGRGGGGVCEPDGRRSTRST